MFPWLKSACNDSLIFASPFDSTHNGGLLKSFVVLQAKKVIAPANCNAPSSAELYGPISLRQARYGNYITAERGTRERCSFVFDVSARCRRSRKYRGGLVRAMLFCFWGVCKMYKIKKVQARVVRTKLFCFWTVCKILTSLCWFKFLANEVLCDVTLPSARAHGHWTSSIVHRTRISLYITGLSYSLIKFTMYPIRMHDFNKKQFVDPKSLISNMPPYLACRRLSPITSSNFN